VKWSTQPANSYNPVVLRGAIEPCRHGPVTNRPSRLFRRPDFSPAQPSRAETRLVPSKAATLRLTIVSRFTPHGSWERRENDAGGLFQQPAQDSSTWMTALPLYVPQFKQV